MASGRKLYGVAKGAGLSEMSYTPARALIFALSFLWVGDAAACSSDADCHPGQHCAKAPGAVYGVCEDDGFPGNSDDRQPITTPLNVSQTYGALSMVAEKRPAESTGPHIKVRGDPSERVDRVAQQSSD
jgi:hypothetical protein